MVSFCCEIFLLCAPPSDANLLHCRSPFYLCFEHVDNLGAYTASRSETGLLISSDCECNGDVSIVMNSCLLHSGSSDTSCGERRLSGPKILSGRHPRQSSR